MSDSDRKKDLVIIHGLIKEKKLTEAIEKCKIYLNEHPNSYQCHMLIGAAYTNNNNKIEAAKHLRKALELCKGSPISVLRGLIGCVLTEELPDVYKQLLPLESEDKYYCESIEKISIHSQNPQVFLDFFELIKQQAETNINDNRKNVVMRTLCGMCVSGVRISDVDDQSLKSTFEVLIEYYKDQEKHSEIHVHKLYLRTYKKYIKLLYKLQDYKNCLKHASLIVQQNAEDEYAYEWICKIYSEYYKDDVFKDWQNQLEYPIEHYSAKLVQLNEKSSLGLLVKSIIFYNQQQYVPCRDLLNKVRTLVPDNIVAIDLLATINMVLGAFEIAMNLWHEIDNDKMYAICASHTADRELNKSAIKLLQTLEQSTDVVEALARCYFSLKDFDALKRLQLNDIAKAEYLLEPVEAIELIEHSEDSDSFSRFFLLGKLYFKISNYSSSLTWTLKATRIQSYRAECFLYLGKCYFISNDIERARKCLEKCLNLNPVCEEAVNHLSIIYQQLGEDDINVSLLQTTLKHMQPEKSERVQYNLGLHYLKVYKFDNAIQAFRTSIKYNVNHVVYWESLGDAYAQRGSYNSAIRVFQKILELDADNVYAKLQIALVKTTIRMYTEAITDFDNLLHSHPDYLPALKGAADAHIGLANNLKLEHRYGRCKEHLQLAVNHLQRVFCLNDYKNMMWIWRLTANVFVKVARMPTSMANLKVSGKLANREEDIICLDRRDLFSLATRFYTCALAQKENTYLWYEFALCSYYSAQYMPDEAEQHLNLAINACKMAIQKQSNFWENWNLLGVIYMQPTVKNLALSQHCFIQALNFERKSYTAWTNLGVLYLSLMEIKLANLAFQRAQQSNPVFQNAWIGQALIAEVLGEDEESMDIFRHCQQLGYNSEACLGYANWVCSTLTNKEKLFDPYYQHALKTMHADIVALDGINWYSVYEENNASAAGLSFYGFLLERHHLYRAASKAYLKAAERAQSKSQSDSMYTNLGFLYIKMNDPHEAVKALNMVSTKKLKTMFGLCLAYHRAGNNSEAYELYGRVLEKCVEIDKENVAGILLAMTSLIYPQGPEDTRQVLFQCLLEEHRPVTALYAACAIGILHGDIALGKSIAEELSQYRDSPEHCAHIAYLMAYYMLSRNEPHKALRYLLQRLHVNPHLADLRKVIANFILDNIHILTYPPNCISQISLGALQLLHYTDISKSNAVEDAELLLLAGLSLQDVDRQWSKILTQHAIRLNPVNRSAWQLLQKVA